MAGLSMLSRVLLIMFFLACLVFTSSIFNFLGHKPGQTWVEIVPKGIFGSGSEEKPAHPVGNDKAHGKHRNRNRNRNRNRKKARLGMDVDGIIGSPILIASTPGVDAQIVSEILSAATVPVARQKNKLGDSSVFNQLFSNIATNLFKDEWRMEVPQMSEALHRKLRHELEKFGNATSLKVLDKSHKISTLTSALAPIWCFQSSLGLYMIPILKHHFPELVVVHVIDNGKYTSLSKSARREDIELQSKFLKINPQSSLTSNQNQAVSSMKIWSRVNKEAAVWSLENLKNNYVPFRLDEFCSNRQEYATAFISRLGLKPPVMWSKIERHLNQAKATSVNNICSRPIGTYLAVKDYGFSFANKVDNFGREGMDYFGFRNSSKYRIGLQKGKLLNAANSVAQNKTLIVVAITESYIPLFLNWLAGLHRIGLRNVMVFCVDHGCKTQLTQMGIANYQDRAECCTNTRWDILTIRNQYVQTLLSYGFHLLSSDIDTYWNRNPFPYLTDSTADIQFMEGRDIPYPLYNTSTGPVSLSFVYIRNSKKSRTFWKQFSTSFSQEKNERISFNQVLTHLQVKWNVSTNGTEKCGIGHCVMGTSPNQDILLSILDKSYFSFPGLNRTSENYVVYHADKDDLKSKISGLKKVGAWKLRKTFNGIINRWKPFQNKPPSSERIVHDYELSEKVVIELLTNRSINLKNVSIEDLQSAIAEEENLTFTDILKLI